MKPRVLISISKNKPAGINVCHSHVWDSNSYAEGPVSGIARPIKKKFNYP
jgi:hypothetical protein